MRSHTHSTAVLDGNVELGHDVEIGALCYLSGHVIIARGSKLFPNVIVGTACEHRTEQSAGAIRIGEDTTIRELTVIQRGTGDRDTSIGDRCYLMDHVHVGHDSSIGDDCTISPNVVLPGHTLIHRGATIGLGAVMHQRTTIGAYAMVGMGSVVTRDVPPFALVMGNPARWTRWNTRAIEALGITGKLEDSEIWMRAMDRFVADSRRRKMVRE